MSRHRAGTLMRVGVALTQYGQPVALYIAARSMECERCAGEIPAGAQVTRKARVTRDWDGYVLGKCFPIACERCEPVRPLTTSQVRQMGRQQIARKEYAHGYR
jgi:hypothetical protein